MRLTARSGLIGAAVFFLVYNFAGGVLYTIIKFDVLDHSTGTGVTPGPWLVVPFLAIGVFPVALVFGLLLHVGRRVRGRTSGDLTVPLLLAFVVCSIVFHVFVIRSIVLDPDEYAWLAARS